MWENFEIRRSLWSRFGVPPWCIGDLIEPRPSGNRVRKGGAKEFFSIVTNAGATGSGFLTLALLLLVAGHALAQPPDPDDDQKKKIIEAARARALAYSKELPDFTCRQVTRRSEDPKGLNQWRTLETINEQLDFIGHKEEYHTISVNGKKTENHSGGLMRSSEFADFLTWIFDPKYKAEIAWSKWDALRGHRVHELGFRVTPENSKFTVSKGKGQAVTAGMFGVIDVDSESWSILKLGIVATDIPAHYPVQGVATELHYEFAKLGDHYYLLPFKADLHSKEGKTQIWNEIEFHDFRKPEAAK